MSARFTVQVDADQFDRLARPTQPLAAVAELVWNSLDAEAQAVTVSIGRTELDAVDTVVVTDDGHGMVTIQVARTGVQGLPVIASRMASMPLMPFFRAVEM